jgi:hypothetical protein
MSYFVKSLRNPSIETKPSFFAYVHVYSHSNSGNTALNRVVVMLFDGYRFPSSVFYTNEEEKQLLASLLELQRGLSLAECISR